MKENIHVKRQLSIKILTEITIRNEEAALLTRIGFINDDCH